MIFIKKYLERYCILPLIIPFMYSCNYTDQNDKIDLTILNNDYNLKEDSIVSMLEAGDTGLAIKTTEKFIDEYPENNYQWYHSLGVIYFNRGEYVMAEDSFTKAIESVDGGYCYAIEWRLLARGAMLNCDGAYEDLQVFEEFGKSHDRIEIYRNALDSLCSLASP